MNKIYKKFIELVKEEIYETEIAEDLLKSIDKRNKIINELNKLLKESDKKND